MKALTVKPQKPDSLALSEIEAPTPHPEDILAETLAVGICGTDREILAGDYGTAPRGRDRLIIGHEMLARVKAAPEDSGFAPGDLLVGIVRMPDPVPCRNCAAGEWDMCKNGRFKEHGIKELDGFASELVSMRPERAMKVPATLGLLGVLVEPASVVAKAWEQIDRIGARAVWEPERALIIGAGPIGLLAALLARQRGLETHVYDRAERGLKPELVRSLGAHYHLASDERLEDIAADADVIVECTGVAELIWDAMRANAANGIVCLAGVSANGRPLKADIGAFNRTTVLQNDVVFGSVNANRRHYAAAITALCKADPAWLGRLITRRVPLARYREAFVSQSDDIKTILEFVKT